MLKLTIINMSSSLRESSPEAFRSPGEEIRKAIKDKSLRPYKHSGTGNPSVGSLLRNSGQLVLQPGKRGMKIFTSGQSAVIDTDSLVFMGRIPSSQGIDDLAKTQTQEKNGDFEALVITPTYYPEGIGVDSSRAEVYAAMKYRSQAISA